MDFSTEFVALRDRLLETQDKAFRTQTNVEVAGRMAALCSSFTIKSERKILGLMPTGGVGHAHEYRLLFAVPKLGADELADWWAYAEKAFETLVEPDENHDFSITRSTWATGRISRGLSCRTAGLTSTRNGAPVRGRLRRRTARPSCRQAHAC